MNLRRFGKQVIVAWADNVVGQSIVEGTPYESIIIKDGIDPLSVEGARDIPYDIADFRCEPHTTEAAVPVLSWRSGCARTNPWPLG